jgi:hypothetical protein
MVSRGWEEASPSAMDGPNAISHQFLDDGTVPS